MLQRSKRQKMKKQGGWIILLSKSSSLKGNSQDTFGAEIAQDFDVAVAVDNGEPCSSFKVVQIHVLKEDVSRLFYGEYENICERKLTERMYLSWELSGTM